MDSSSTLDPHRLAWTGDILLRTLFVFICEEDAEGDLHVEDSNLLYSTCWGGSRTGTDFNFLIQS